jgi:hypothetical protein
MDAKMGFLDTSIITMAQIIIELDLREGLALEMVLQRGNHVITQILGYCKVPFKYVRCHRLSHLV